MSDIIGTSVFCSVESTLTITMLVGFGFIFACTPKQEPILHYTNLRPLSRLAISVCMPAFLFSNLGKNFTPKILHDVGISCVLAFILLGIHGMSASVCKYMFPDTIPGYFKDYYMLVFVCTNTFSLPITMMRVICNTGILEDVSTEDCIVLSTTYLTVFSTIAPQLLVWTLIRPYLKTLNYEETRVLRPRLTHVLSSGNLNEEYASQRSNPMNRSEAEESFHRSRRTKSLSEVLSAANLNKIESISPQAHGSSLTTDITEDLDFLNTEEPKSRIDWYDIVKGLITTLTKRNVVGIILGVIVGLIPPLQTIFNPQSSWSFIGASIHTLGLPAIPLMLLVMAGNIGNGILHMISGRQSKPPYKLIALMTLGSMIISPTLMFVIMWGLGKILDIDPLLTLSILLCSGMPTSNILIAVGNEMNHLQQCETTSLILIFQYGFGVLSITLVLIAANIFIQE